MAYRKPLAFILPEDAVALRAATALACTKAGAICGVDRDRIADAVLWLAQGGHGRREDGTIDPEAIAEDVIANFWQRRIPSAAPARVSAFADLPVALF